METGCQHTGLVHRQWSLSLFSPLLLYSSFTQSSLPHPPLSYFPFLFCFLPWFSSIHVSLPSPRSPIPFLLFPLSFSLTFLPLSIHSCQPRCHVLTSLSLSLLSSFSPLVTSSSSSLFPFIHPCVYLCLISFNSPYLYLSIGRPFYPSLLFSISAYWSDTHTQTLDGKFNTAQN